MNSGRNAVVVAALLGLACSARAATNLIANANFELTETGDAQQWFPQIATAGVINAVPNSSFECGTAGWGSFTWGLSSGAGNLYRLVGELDPAQPHHGAASLRIALNPATLPVFWFDYYRPVRQPVRRVLVANHGWFRVTPGEPLTLSAYLRADAAGVVAQLAGVEPSNRLNRRAVTVGPVWERYTHTFTPRQPFVFIAVGLDLEASQRDAATLWVDAIQLERGWAVSPYAPRQPVESFVATGPAANRVEVLAYNDAGVPALFAGQLVVTDFFDRTNTVAALAETLPPRRSRSFPITALPAGRFGFYRATWAAPGATNALRGAVLEPPDTTATDSPLGFNHAYPWDFLVESSHRAGVGWWRDWSAKWQTVEPRRGEFDFAAPDAQIQRVLKLGGQVEVLLPFPSAAWSTTARPDQVAKAAGANDYLRARLPLAYAPKDWDDFGRYAAAVARHYRPDVTHYQVLNEPLSSDYALPRNFGYRVADYRRGLAVAQRAIKEVDPHNVVVGGISDGPGSSVTREFIEAGGLQLLDVLDLHLYDAPRPAEDFDEPFRALADLMRTHGGPKPVWITEWGCYADDDPPCWPPIVGDATMNRCRWPSERAATEHIVKFAAVSFAHGVRKIFFHAGTCGTINGPDAGGVLFEYGGAPRKMYPGIAVLTRRLGVPDECLRRIARNGFQACVFRTGRRFVAIVWSDPPRQLPIEAPVQASDIMGNSLPGPRLAISESPVYLTAPNADALLNVLGESAP